MPKSGSSTITKGLYTSRDLLKKKNYFYPLSAIKGTKHVNIFFELCSFPEHRVKFKPERGDLDALINEISSSKYDNAFICSESLALLKKSEISYLARKLSQFDVTVVVYLRRQDQVIQSGWSQNTKAMITKRSLEQNIEDEISNTRSVYHYDHLLRKWASVFGKDNMVVRVLERDKLKGHIFHDFLDVCKVKGYESFPIPNSANVSPSARTIGLILELSNLLEFDQIDRLVRREIGKHIQSFGNSKGWNEGFKFNQIDEQVFKLVMDHFEDGNLKVAREYFDRDTLFDDPFIAEEKTSFSLDEISNQDLLEMFSHILYNTYSSEAKTNLSLDNISNQDLLKLFAGILNTTLPKTSFNE